VMIFGLKDEAYIMDYRLEMVLSINPLIKQPEIKLLDNF